MQPRLATLVGSLLLFSMTPPIARAQIGVVMPLDGAVTYTNQPPSGPVLDGDAAGDTQLRVTWVEPADVQMPTGARFYLDPNGCGHDSAPSSFFLTPGATPPSAMRVASVEPDGTGAFDQATLETAALGWTTSRYGQTGVLAMTVIDDLGNESELSNLVCVYHARCTGDGGSTPDCGPTGLCAIAAPGGEPPSSMLGLVALGALLIARARARS